MALNASNRTPRTIVEYAFPVERFERAIRRLYGADLAGRRQDAIVGEKSDGSNGGAFGGWVGYPVQDFFDVGGSSTPLGNLAGADLTNAITQSTFDPTMSLLANRMGRQQRTYGG